MNNKLLSLTALLSNLIFLLTSCASPNSTTGLSKRQPASVAALKYTCALNPIRHGKETYEECFEKYEKSLKRLNCKYEKEECIDSNPLSSDNSMPKTCSYTSDNCTDAGDNKKCESNYYARWLDDNQNRVICVKASGSGQENQQQKPRGTVR